MCWNSEFHPINNVIVKYCGGSWRRIHVISSNNIKMLLTMQTGLPYSAAVVSEIECDGTAN